MQEIQYHLQKQYEMYNYAATQNERTLEKNSEITFGTHWKKELTKHFHFQWTFFAMEIFIKIWEPCEKGCVLSNKYSEVTKKKC